jgi:hypothetical protein
MNFNRNIRQSRRWNVLNRAAAAFSSIGAEYSASRGLNPFYTNQEPYHEDVEHYSTRQDRLLQSISRTFMQPLLSILSRHVIQKSDMQRNPILQSILNMPKLQPADIHNNNAVVQAAVKSKSKQQSSTKKRRKNNTGFYYGIREDVVIFPDRSREDGRPRPSAIVPKNHSEPSKLKCNEHPKSSFKSTDLPSNKASREEQEKPSKKESQSPRPRNEARTKKKNRALGIPKIKTSESGIFEETLQELRAMKKEIVALREELRSVKGQLHEREESPTVQDKSTTEIEKPKWWGRPSTKEPELETPASKLDDEVVSSLPSEQANEEETATKLSPRLRRREFEQIGRNVETWACGLLFDKENKEEGGWKEIECNKFCRKKFNPDGRTQVYLKWMPDSRNDNGDNVDDSEGNISGEEQDFPCIKCYSTIDAPMDKVCSFLSNENTIPVYNELVEDYSEIEEITPHSKITWCKMPKVMFVKSRDFVTYCSHRWWKDGTQVIVNQACEHEDKPGILVEGEGEACRGYALRGANFISKDPNDPNKTRITLLAHANPGGGLPQWAMTTAVNAVVQIEPFKLFHNINQGVSTYTEPSSSIAPSHQFATVNSLPGRSNKPAGMAQMGYVCFWPNGGGLREKHSEQIDEDDDVILDEF